jgi:Fungal specific transcription factor domain/Fungal Zn(2)-Cys(6) binuclear cluster domain
MIKCDLKRPACSQCHRTGRTCLGYRDQIDLVFRDESQRITRKCRKLEEARNASSKPAKSHPSRCSEPPAEVDVSTQSSPTTMQEILWPAIHQPIQDVGICYLLGDYIRGSHFDYLPSLYSSAHQNSLLHPVVQAVGLASLALQTSRPELELDADKLYAIAISRTNCALQSPEAAQDHEALASIMLLSLFETLRLRRECKTRAWTAHVQGALALVALHGTAQFETKLGLELFKQISASIRVFCVQQNVRVPKSLSQMTMTAKLKASPEDVSFDFATVVEAFADLRADMSEGYLTQPREIIAAAHAVLQKLQTLISKLPTSYDAETIWITNRSPEVCEEHYFKYKDHHTAQLWNTSWQAQVVLNTIIYEQAVRESVLHAVPLSDSYDYKLMAAEAQRQATAAAHAICASVPSFFPPDTDKASRHRRRNVAVGYFLIWPLFAAGSCSFIPLLTKEYIIDRLRFISTDLRIPQAHQAAEMLAHNDQLEDWYVIISP